MRGNQAARFVHYLGTCYAPAKSMDLTCFSLPGSADQSIRTFRWERFGRAWNFVLFTRGMCAYIMGPMDRIRTHKNMQRKAELDQGLRDILGKLSREKLRNIPESRLNGIHALPVELWSQIIDLCFQPRRRQCRDVFRVLRLRFVCRTL